MQEHHDRLSTTTATTTSSSSSRQHVASEMTLRIGAIIRQARQAQQEWARTSFKERGRSILRIKAYIHSNAEQIASEISQTTGKPRIEALAAEVISCALACQWYAKNTAKHLAPQRLPVSSFLFLNKKTTLYRQPLGVVAIFSPWNYPLAIPFGEVIMGLMAGNAVILKVADETRAVGRLIASMIEQAKLPPHLFTLVEGDAAEISESLFAQGIDKLFFTGSVRVGKLLMKKASETLTPLCLELGGKDPMVVLEDADLERASNGALWAGFQNAGQTCAGVERIYVHEKIYPQFLDLLARKTKALRQGPDRAFNVEVGAITTKRQYETIARHVEDALSKGARVAGQTQLPASLQGIPASADKEVGVCYFPATVLADVSHDMTVMSEETFGPVLGVMKFTHVEEAIKLANQSSYALTASVWSGDLARAKRIALQLQAGVCTINDHLFTHALSEVPWGGFKQSGMGRTHGKLGLEEMTQVKAVTWDLLPAKRNVYWYPYSEATYRSLLAAIDLVHWRGPLQMMRALVRFAPYYLRKSLSSWRT